MCKFGTFSLILSISIFFWLLIFSNFKFVLTSKKFSVDFEKVNEFATKMHPGYLTKKFLPKIHRLTKFLKE
jgi:hypothetical protein